MRVRVLHGAGLGGEVPSYITVRRRIPADLRNGDSCNIMNIRLLFFFMNLMEIEV